MTLSSWEFFGIFGGDDHLAPLRLSLLHMGVCRHWCVPARLGQLIARFNCNDVSESSFTRSPLSAINSVDLSLP